MKQIAYICDSLSWIQAQRAKDLQPYLPEHELHVMLPSFATLSGPWDAVWVASWRILLAHPEIEDRLPRDRTLASVTSHYNIGGGLNPSMCFRKGADPDAEFQKAITTLKRFRLVTCNSKILWDILAPHLLPNLVLAQNGVDAEFFLPQWSRDFTPRWSRLGWVGKDKGAKNIQVFMEALRKLDGDKATFFAIVPKKRGGPVKDRSGMSEFYQKLDFFVCTSWHEGTPNGLLEGASCGLPAITTAVGNAPEIVREGETGWFIEPTAESLIACVERLQHLQSWEYRRMSHKIREDIVNSWTWAKRAEPYRKALEVVCGHSRID